MKKKSLICILRTVCICCVIFIATGIFSRQKNYEKGNMYLGSGNSRKAAFYYTLSLVFDPDNPDAYGGALAAMNASTPKFISQWVADKAKKNDIYGDKLENHIILHQDIEDYKITRYVKDGIKVEMYNAQDQLIQKGHLYRTASPWWIPLELFSYHDNGRVATKIKYNSSNGEKIAEYAYNDSGVKLLEVIYNTQNNKKEKEFHYNDAGLLTAEVYFAENKDAEQRIYYTYNENGKLTTEKHQGKENKLLEYIYDNSEKCIQIVEKKPADGTTISTTDINYEGNIKVSTKIAGYKQIKTIYEDNQIVKVEECLWSNTSLTDNTGRLVPNKIEYFENGKLIKEENYRFFSGRLESINYYTNGVKRRTETYSKRDDDIYLSGLVIFDESERVTERTVYYAPDKLISIEKYTYGKPEIYEEYNRRGNLVYRKTKDASAEKEEFFSNNDSTTPLYTATEYPGSGKKSVNFPRADMKNSRPLTEEEVQQVNTVLTLKDFNKVHPLECFFNTGFAYGSPQEINLSSVVSSMVSFSVYGDSINHFQVSVLNMDSVQQLASLKKEGAILPYDAIETNGRTYYRVRYSVVDSLLKKYADISLKDITNPHTPVKSDVYSSFYTDTSSYYSFECIGGEINDNWLKLYSEYKTRIFRRDGDRFYIYALIDEANTGKPDVYIEPKDRTTEREKTYTLKDVSIDVDGRSNAYRNAAAKYTAFLQQTVDNLRREWEGEFSYQALSYALVDLSRDGIPELVTRVPDPFAPYDVYMIIDNQVQHIDTVGGYGGDGGVTVLPSGYMMGHMRKIEFEWYDFYWYNNDGSINEFHFGIDQDYYRDDVKYQVNGKYVSRRDYIAQTRSYYRLRTDDNRYDITWYEMQEKAEQ